MLLKIKRSKIMEFEENNLSLLGDIETVLIDLYANDIDLTNIDLTETM
jgi:hypothetical protein